LAATPPTVANVLVDSPPAVTDALTGISPPFVDVAAVDPPSADDASAEEPPAVMDALAVVERPVADADALADAPMNPLAHADALAGTLHAATIVWSCFSKPVTAWSGPTATHPPLKPPASASASP